MSDDWLLDLAEAVADANPDALESELAAARSSLGEDDSQESEAIEALASVARLMAAYENGSDASESIVSALPRSENGDSDASLPEVGEKWGHLTLVDRLGSGAHGTVYRAYDGTLKREVALKLIATRDASRPRLERLLQEGQLLAKVRHNNVAIVYQTEHRDEALGIFMEYIHGKTLSQIVQEDGEHGAKEAAAIGCELALALATAHSVGVIHQDVKAQNVIRERGGRVVLVDFGVGVEMEHLAALRPEEAVGGTPLYLAPEVLKGGLPSIKSDIYSLGVLLFYLATGRYPYRATSLKELRSLQSEKKAALIQGLRPDLPDDFARCVEKAIDPNPENRYDSMAEFARVLDTCSTHLTTTHPLVTSDIVPGVETKPRSFTLRRWLGAAVLALVATVAWFGVSSQPEDSADSPIRIAVLPILMSDNNEDDPLTKRIAIATREELRGGGVDFVPDNSIRAARGTLSEMASQLGADYLIAGDVEPNPTVDGGLMLSVQLTRGSDDLLIWEDNLSFVPQDEEFAGLWLARSALEQIAIADSPSRPEMPRRTGDLTLRLEQGLELIRGYYDPGSLREAISIFDEVAKADPNNAEAFAHLAGARCHLHFNQSDRTNNYSADASEALERALELAPGDSLTLYAEGQFFYYCEREYEAALEKLEAAALQDSANSSILETLGLLQRRLGNWDAAVRTLDQNAAFNPQDARTLTHQLELFLAIRDGQRALDAGNEATSLEEVRSAVWEFLSQVHLSLFDDAEEALRTLNLAPPQHAAKLGFAKFLVRYHDRQFEEALSELTHDVMFFERKRTSSDLHWKRALLEQRLGNSQAATQTAQLGLEQLRRKLEEDPMAYEVRGDFAVLLALLGEHQEALAQAERAVRNAVVDRFTGPRTLESKAIVHAMAGRHDEALTILEELIDTPSQRPVTAARLRRSPVWDDMRELDRFKALTNRPSSIN